MIVKPVAVAVHSIILAAAICEEFGGTYAGHARVTLEPNDIGV